jgi:amino acid efflux transporter
MSELQRTIGLGQGVAMYVAAVMGPGVLVLPALAAETAGPLAIAAWLLLIVVSLPICLSFADLARAYPEAGGFQVYVERAFGPSWGAVSGWLFFLQWPSAVVAVTCLIAGPYGASLFGLGRTGQFAIGGSLMAVIALINWLGLKLSARLQVIVIVTIVALMLTAITGAMPHVQAANFHPVAPHGWLAVGTAAIQLFWAFSGFEAITPLAEEFKDPRRDMRRASLIALAIVAVVYASLAIATIGVHAYGAGLGGQAPFGFMAVATFGAPAATITSILAVFVSFGAVNSYTAGTSRLGYAMGRSERFPRWFGVVDDRFHAPHRALAVMLLAYAGWFVATYFLRLDLADLFPISTSSYIVTYILSMAAAAKLLTGWGRINAWIGLVSCAVILLFVGAFFAWIGGVTVACLAYQHVVRRRKATRGAEVAQNAS